MPWRWAHPGAFGAGARTAATMVPDEQLGIIVLCNADPTGLPEAITCTFFDEVFKGRSTQPWLKLWNKQYETYVTPIQAKEAQYSKPPRPVVRPSANSAYVGEYFNDYVGKVVVEQKDGRLSIRLGAKMQPFPLKHYTGNEFLYFMVAEYPKMPSIAKFVLGPNGKATGVDLGDFVFEGQSLLKRTK
jgi:hypothetical protein